MKNRLFLSLSMMNCFYNGKRLYFQKGYIDFRSNAEETTLYLLALVKNLDIDTQVRLKDGDNRYKQRTKE